MLDWAKPQKGENVRVSFLVPFKLGAFVQDDSLCESVATRAMSHHEREVQRNPYRTYSWPDPYCSALTTDLTLVKQLEASMTCKLWSIKVVQKFVLKSLTYLYAGHIFFYFKKTNAEMNSLIL